MTINRIDGRELDEIRGIKITNDYLMHPEGSVLIEMGHTKVICTASIEDKVPPFLKGSGEGWITAEYGMLPRSTGKRKVRESSRGKVDGRTQEIQRLIGRSLRNAVDLKSIGERTIWIDCDVIQADGGTRTASITGAFVALVIAVKKLCDDNKMEMIPIKSYISAISVGMVEGQALLDLCYHEDSNAEVDMNVVMTDQDEFIEIQGTGEEATFKITELNDMIALARKGCHILFEKQKEILGDIYDHHSSNSK